ncbi:VirD4-like conjugal transfer protein, CD1115 family [Sinanaerobacter sp. ZZT-01]|uniref:VirD4-like conjugal transfer protein, CD1115 family n=1 Tax=Sinanaerobacter sp. ZZT-01 TaxID=3111540 RepID=UPI002D779A16|nr:type IV secretory system conjugative DNA transfer family protein [Sinanaerobacter sp. ZZT-01]WRR94243.1 type IV secretory system conjugative DNA transfer family protein [Sinanaerobacter sp. ZZT-01]
MAITEQERRRKKRRSDYILMAVSYVLGSYLMLHIGVCWPAYLEFNFLSDLNALLYDATTHMQLYPLSFAGASLEPFKWFTFIAFMGVVWYISSRKKLMPGKEHGTARWAEKEEGKRLADKVFKNNIILTLTECLSLNSRKIRKNANVLVIGDSGAGKTRSYVKPNLMQLHTSYVITDPKGEILQDTGKMLEKNGYEIRVFNLVDMAHSYCYSPFHYIEKEEDVMKVISCLIRNTTPSNSSVNDPFWEKAETALLQALFFFIWYKLPKDEQNFNTVLRLIRMAVVDEEDSSFESDLDILFEQLRKEDPDNVAICQYDIFKKAAGKTAKSIIISAGVRLAIFNIPAVANLTQQDTLDIRQLPERKMALFLIIPDSDKTFNFIVAMMYTQMFLLFSNIAFRSKGRRLKNHVRFILDEFANIGEIPDFSEQASTMRSKNFSVTIILQHLAQLEELYKKSWKAIVNCCNTKLYLGGDEQSTTEYFSKMLGKETIDVQTGNLTRGRHRSATQNYNKQARELMMPDEIGQMPDTDCFVLIKGVHPFYSQKYDLTKHPNYKLLYDEEEHPENFFDYKSIVTPVLQKKDTMRETVKQQKVKKADPSINLKELQVSVEGIQQMRYALEYEF